MLEHCQLWVTEYGAAFNCTARVDVGTQRGGVWGSVEPSGA